MNIPFNDFTREYTTLRQEIDQAVHRVLESGWFILGKEVDALETELAAYLGTKYCVTVANGTEAIALALMAVKVGKGDEVITTNMTAFPTITGIEQSGAKAVVVDIDEETGLIDPAEISKHISPKTKAILPVHLYGQAANLNKILEIAKKHNLLLIEDCAQAFGAEYKGRKVGSFGQVNALSFYPTKNLGAYGDGGAVSTNDSQIYQKLLQLRNYGQRIRYYHDQQGINSRLDELQAAILRVKLKLIDQSIHRRREIAHYYYRNIQKMTTIPEVAGNFHTYHLFVLKTAERQRFMEYLQKKGITSIIHYPVPINEQKAFQNQKEESFPRTKKFTDQVVSIPLYPELTQSEVEYIVQTINSFSATASL